jgi:glycosyltransferase involved in cell wall biosynthesis
MSYRMLYLCYFGLREPLVQTQVLPYLQQLKSSGIEIYLLTFEPEIKQRWSRPQLESEQARLLAEGINWFYLPYHKRPTLPATLYDIAAGVRLAARLKRRKGINVLHGRSHVGAAIGALTKRMTGGKLIFDIRGFMPEEYVDAGRWAGDGYLYRGTKAVERWLMAASDGFIVLTEQAREILFPGCADTDPAGRPFAVIPCCVDRERFRVAENLSREEARRELGLTDRKVFVYVGAFGGWYLTEEIAHFLSLAHRQDPATFSMIITQSDPKLVQEQLQRRNIPETDILIRQVTPEQVPHYLRAADIALSFIKPCYSKLSSSPTKIAEYLAAGLPIISSGGIGDVDTALESDRVGVILRNFNEAGYLEALRAMEQLRSDSGLAERCRESARQRFDLETVGGREYRNLYQRLLKKSGKTAT